MVEIIKIVPFDLNLREAAIVLLFTVGNIEQQQQRRARLSARK